MKEINKINFNLRTIKKLKGVIYLIENLIWKCYPKETQKLEKEIYALERRKENIKRHEEIQKKKAEPGYISPINQSKDISMEEIKAIPIRNVIESYGIKIERNNFFKLRSERTSSAQFNEEKNLFYDHGNSQGGSVIDLVMAKEGIVNGNAIKLLIEKFL